MAIDYVVTQTHVRGGTVLREDRLTEEIWLPHSELPRAGGLCQGDRPPLQHRADMNGAIEHTGMYTVRPAIKSPLSSIIVGVANELFGCSKCLIGSKGSFAVQVTGIAITLHWIKRTEKKTGENTV